MAVASHLVQRKMCVHIIPNFGAVDMLQQWAVDWLGEGSRKTCNNENIAGLHKIFQS